MNNINRIKNKYYQILFYTPLLWLMLSVSAESSSQPGYTVTGNIQDGGNGMVYLVEYKGKGNYDYFDSARMMQGKFILKGSVLYPRYVVVSFDRQPPRIGFWLENGHITLLANADSLNQAKVKGSITQLQYEETQAFLQPLDLKCRAIAQIMVRAKDSGNAAQVHNLQQRLDSCWAGKVEATIRYIKAHSNWYPAAAMLKNISYALTWQQLQDIISTLDPVIANSGAIDIYRERIASMKKTDKGDKAPDFVQNNPDGKSLRFYSILSANKLVLLDFWASWCGPCRRENPNLVKIYQQFHPRGFEIVSVSLDNKKENWVKAIRDDGLPWIHVSNLQYWNNPIVNQYGISAVPANVLIDGNGLIIARNLKGDALKDIVQRYLQR